MQTDLNDVQTFVTVSEHGTFTAAASRLKLPTSTVSRSITRLEQALATTLYRRSPKGLSLTEEGKAYLDACKQALKCLHTGHDLLERHRAKPGGLIRIACPLTLARDVLAPLLTEFADRYPALRVQVHPYCSGWEQEPRAGVDLFFKLTAPQSSTKNMRVFPGTRRALFASSAYLQAHGSPQTPADLVAHRCVGSGTWELKRGEDSVTPSVTFQVVTSDPGSHLRLACENFGVAVLPLWMAEGAQGQGKLVHILEEWTATPIPVCALYSGATRLTPKVGVFLEFLSEYFGTERDPRLNGQSPAHVFTDTKAVREDSGQEPRRSSPVAGLSRSQERFAPEQ